MTKFYTLDSGYSFN